MDVQAALENWARWVRGRTIQGHCASIEYKFRFRTSPDVDWREAPPTIPLPPIDVLQALAIERCMRHLPEGHRLALALYYVGRLPYRGCCRILHLGYDMWDRYLADAQGMVSNLFTYSENRGIRAPTIRLPAFAAYI